MGRRAPPASGPAATRSRPGVECVAVDRASRDVIDAAGWGETFAHGTGHGVGPRDPRGPAGRQDGLWYLGSRCGRDRRTRRLPPGGRRGAHRGHPRRHPRRRRGPDGVPQGPRGVAGDTERLRDEPLVTATLSVKHLPVKAPLEHLHQRPEERHGPQPPRRAHDRRRVPAREAGQGRRVRPDEAEELPDRRRSRPDVPRRREAPARGHRQARDAVPVPRRRRRSCSWTTSPTTSSTSTPPTSASAVSYLKEGDPAILPMYDGAVVGVELPAAVELTVTETEPGVQGDRVSGRPQGGDARDRARRPGAAVRRGRASGSRSTRAPGSTSPAPERVAIMATRREARERALGLCYELDARHVDRRRPARRPARAPGRVRRAPSCGASTSTATEIDALLTKFSEHWAVDRMPAVDRALLRIGDVRARLGARAAAGRRDQRSRRARAGVLDEGLGPVRERRCSRASPRSCALEARRRPGRGRPRPSRRRPTTPVEVQDPETFDVTATDKPWIVIVWNDPVNLIVYVVLRAAEAVRVLARAKAMRLTMQVHHEGKAVVSSGHAREGRGRRRPAPRPRPLGDDGAPRVTSAIGTRT